MTDLRPETTKRYKSMAVKENWRWHLTWHYLPISVDRIWVLINHLDHEQETKSGV